MTEKFQAATTQKNEIQSKIDKLKGFIHSNNIKRSHELAVIDKQLIDCGKNLYRNTKVVFFEEWNATGKELYKSIIDEARWHDVKTNSVQEELMKKVCFSV
jgi:recombinational DNA repair ATPase RecF